MSEPDNALLPAKFPADWTISTVGAQFHVILGKMLDAEKNIGTPKPYLGNRSVQWGRVDLSDLDQIKLTEGDMRKYRLQTGDLLVCEGGDIGRAAIWQDQLDDCYFQKALHRLRPRGSYLPVLMRYLLEYYAKTGFLTNFATQTSIAHLPKDKFVTVPLPLPPLREQQAIAAALSDADAVVAGLERVIAKKRLIKQGAMQDLLTARRRLPGFSGEWEVKRLGDLMSMKSGDAITSAFIHEEGDYPVFGGNGLRGFTNSFNRDGECTLVGRQGALCGVVTHTVGKIFASEHAIVCKATAPNCQQFISHRLEYADLNKVSESSAQPGLSVEKIKKIEIDVPLDGLEQKAIAAVLSDIDAEIQTLESRLGKARAVKEGMMQNLLTGRVRLV
ncbi:MAG: restriction endonuclease subunit S [Rhodobacteraceae bacterium]|nr:restriction endonuclease subunit S [Paracoccaceae bacterium]MCF8515207.1 restriction endonuclease subunit S [Paracoccaceae bacterium]MCF8519609.1 restriction endonuclease subunit S [Paracoccaceae bacterium]